MSFRSRGCWISGELERMLWMASELLHAAPGAATPALVPDVDNERDEAESAMARWVGMRDTYG